MRRFDRVRLASPPVNGLSMSWRRAFGYWLVAGSLLIVHLVIVRQPPRTGSTEVRTSLVKIAPGAVRALVITGTGKHVGLAREGNQWRLQPPFAPLPQDLVGSVVDSLSNLEAVDVVAENTDHLDQFKLDPPDVSFTLDVMNGASVQISFGSHNPNDTAVYAQRAGDPRVYLVGLEARYHVDLLLDAVREGSDRGS